MNKYSYRVYYEDTDAGGVVYYSNYLKFAERARTELLRNIGINQSELAKKDDILFVVRHVEMDLLKPARLDDILDIHTSIEKISAASIIMEQKIFSNNIQLTQIKVKIASVNGNMKPTKLSDSLKKTLSE